MGRSRSALAGNRISRRMPARQSPRYPLARCRDVGSAPPSLPCRICKPSVGCRP